MNDRIVLYTKHVFEAYMLNWKGVESEILSLTSVLIQFLKEKHLHHKK